MSCLHILRNVKATPWHGWKTGNILRENDSGQIVNIINHCEIVHEIKIHLAETDCRWDTTGPSY